ncbi:sensor histidine kinase [Streptomyces sp. CA2R106]|uniref:sensor histidine kinase n=1 Tax=Streptomyces sp. CA2R106 TaxID=3120153 RepID=UPI003009FE8E
MPQRWRPSARWRVPERWRRVGAATWYVPLGPGLLAASLLAEPHGHGTQLGGVADRHFGALAVVTIALECLPLVLSRRWPVHCLALVSAGFCVDQLRGYHSVAGTALPLALLLAGYRVGGRRRLVAAAFTAGYAALAVALARIADGESVSGFVAFYLALALAWGAGAWLRANRAAEAERRRRVAEDTRSAERTRIARELHDVVTHHVTAMVVQAEAARYLTADPDRLDQALSAVTDTGRLAAADLRHLLDLLDPYQPAGDRTPVVGRLATLVEQTRRAGQPVEFTEEGAPPEPAGSSDLVAYRVVQEALTNALKYAHGSRTSVRVRHAGKEITVEVGTDPGPGTAPTAARAAGAARAAELGGSGRGLAGLRERVGVLGGEFRAGPGPDGRFVVHARIPAGSPS